MMPWEKIQFDLEYRLEKLLFYIKKNNLKSSKDYSEYEKVGNMVVANIFVCKEIASMPSLVLQESLWNNISQELCGFILYFDGFLKNKKIDLS